MHTVIGLERRGGASVSQFITEIFENEASCGHIKIKI